MNFGDTRIDDYVMEAYCNKIFAHQAGGWLLQELAKRATYDHMGKELVLVTRGGRRTRVRWTAHSMGVDVRAIVAADRNGAFKVAQKLLTIAARRQRVILRRHFFSTLPRCPAGANWPRTREQLEQVLHINWEHLRLAYLTSTPLIVEEDDPPGTLQVSSYRAIAWQEPPTVLKP